MRKKGVCIMEKKILFLDLDGTLLTDSKDITPENLAATPQQAQTHRRRTA